MLGRSIDDEMGRIAARGSQHAAAAWTSIATHAVRSEEQLQARQQVSWCTAHIHSTEDISFYPCRNISLFFMYIKIFLYLYLYLSCVPMYSTASQVPLEFLAGLRVFWQFATQSLSSAQAVRAVQSDTRLRAQYMAALGEWLLQQGAAKEAGKEVLLEAASLLDPPVAPSLQLGTASTPDKMETDAELLSEATLEIAASQPQTADSGRGQPESSAQPDLGDNRTEPGAWSKGDKQLLVRLLPSLQIAECYEHWDV